MFFQKPQPKPKIGLVLPGGGARAAYQVGVLQAIARLLPKDAESPFSVVTGTSAGSINAVALAIHSNNFRKGVLRIVRVWKNFHSHHVFRSDTMGLIRTGAHWLATLLLGGLGKYNPASLLDRTPLRHLLQKSLAFDDIQKSLDSGSLHALGISASSYTSGRSVVFYQSAEDIEPWDRETRIGIPAKINIGHLMASSAIPMIFSACKVDNAHYGDGSMRQVAPISPALHLGAERILIVGIRKARKKGEFNKTSATYPSLARIAGHVLNSIFLDSLDADLERLERINKTISLIPNRRLEQGGVMLRPINVILISPSKSIDEIAACHAKQLPRPLRFLLRGIGAFGGHGSTLISYLLFEKAYCRELISLGYKDAMRAKDEIMDFLDAEKEPSDSNGTVKRF